MPHVLEPLQGIQRAVCAVAGENGDLESGESMAEDRCERLEIIEGSGTLSDVEYNRLIYDLVNFLEYVGEPSKAQSHKMGLYVLLFLMLFFVFAYLLKREYWKDVH